MRTVSNHVDIFLKQDGDHIYIILNAYIYIITLGWILTTV